jgi:hypothetical protein
LPRLSRFFSANVPFDVVFSDLPTAASFPRLTRKSLTLCRARHAGTRVVPDAVSLPRSFVREVNLKEAFHAIAGQPLRVRAASTPQASTASTRPSASSSTSHASPSPSASWFSCVAFASNAQLPVAFDLITAAVAVEVALSADGLQGAAV